jgi:hypothetical protein
VTTTINGHVLNVAGGGDLQSCVRVSEIPAETADPVGDAQGSMCTPVSRPRVIPAKIVNVKTNTAAKISNTASLHVGEAGRAVAGSVTLNEQPMTVAAAWRQVPPAPGEVSSRSGWVAAIVAGLFRAVILSVLYLLALSIGTRIRAGAAATLIVLAVAAALAVQAAHP